MKINLEKVRRFFLEDQSERLSPERNSLATHDDNDGSDDNDDVCD